MLYWLIPYLVAYNASDSGDWKYGPEHIFKAEVYANATNPMEVAHMYSDIVINFACRPMNTSLIQCRVESATVNNYEVIAGSSFKRDSKRAEEFEIGNVVFQVEFNQEGISRVWFLNTNGSFRLNMIRAIIGTMNTGISLADKKFENYLSREKSVIGICDTSFNIRNKSLTEEEEKDETVIEGYQFDVPALGGPSGDETIVIEKDRNVNECVKKTPYFFGTTEDTIYDLKAGFKSETLINYSQSRIYLGGKSFSAYTENLGGLTFVLRSKSRRVEMRTGEMIRVSLQAIRPAKEELCNTGNLVNVGAGFEPGIPWPERNIESKIKFFM